MSDLISGKEALIALANGQDVQYMNTSNTFKFLGWSNAFGLETNLFFSDRFKFRLKARTITINGIEVPAPFEPKEGDICFIIDTVQDEDFYRFTFSENSGVHKNYICLGAWRTEDEIKQVVSALRTIFKTN